MADENNKLDLNIKVPFQDLITTALTPSAKTIGNAVNGIFRSVLYPLLMLDIFTNEHLEDFQEKTKTKVNQIPDENKDVSKLGIVLKSFEESKYQLNEEILREMFSNLIANTLDNRKNHVITPRYATILSQLSSDDANLLKSILDNGQDNYPTFAVRINNEDGGGLTVTNLYIGFSFDLSAPYVSTSSIDTLRSLGIINIRSESWLTSPEASSFYELAKESDTYKMVQARFPDNQLTIEKGILNVTDFGSEFIKLVVN